MKFKVGDRVKVREDLQENCYYGIARANDDMAKKRGQIFTIKEIDNKLYSMKECNWVWSDEMLKKVEYTYENLKKSPIGTKITFENGEVLVKDDKARYENCDNAKNEFDLKDLKDNTFCFNCGKIIKIEEPTYQTVYEAKEEILDEAEKRYLRGVIRPFIDKVKKIKKGEVCVEEQYIYIILKEIQDSFILPSFKKDTMYKGMKTDKEYTLEELGL